ncbi:transcriptional repressor [Arcobacter lacus]|jgi:Fur family peroxide stress response transcriptional regulator|uniref:Fur family transcriptional regulator n=1 Tax=Arcobacter lacus TaxID=1912876 RepID=UPI0021BB93CF|nr:transcriptional repressor [Arcobacter lacus]MCT7909234.1 transcriptional repressor [Arcobacter lacus]MCT7911320.1 transcriptional repressor [Arcobacter lacus]
MTNYTNLLKDYDLKVTPQRVAIVEELYKNGHMNIDDLYKKLLAKFPSISLATIYKNINAMVEKVFLSEVKIPDTKSVYELVKAEHAHLVCSCCGHIEDVMLDSSDIAEQVSKISSFKVNSTNIVISGICTKCL